MIKYLFEIKNRLILLFITYFSTILISYLYKDVLLFLIVKSSFNKNQFIYFIFTDVTEVFSVYFKLIFIISYQIALFFVIYHFFIFFIPALYRIEYRYIKSLLKKVVLIWFISFLLLNYLIIPLSWNFFLSFQTLILNNSFNIYFEAKLIEFFYFYTSFYYASVLYFQFFVLLFFVLKYINTNLTNIKKFRKLYYFILILSATLLCPDLVTQVFLSIIFILFYEVWLFYFLFKFLK